MQREHFESIKPGGTVRNPDEWCETDFKHNFKEEEFVYVNLHENRESWTAYNGSRIWNTIYNENCMLDEIRQHGLNLS